MPYEISFDHLPCGISATSALEGENVDIITREFSSSEDGDLFVQRLESLPGGIINKILKKQETPYFRYSTVDHLLAVLRKDKTATVYINEIQIATDVSVKFSGKKAGEPVFSNEIAEILKVKFPEIEIPTDAGLVFLFSIDWRKALFFDFSPFSANWVARDYDPEILFAQYFSYLTFQTRFKISDKAWESLIEQKWFPFTSLNDSTVKHMIDRASKGQDIDAVLEIVFEELSKLLPIALERWKSKEIYVDDLPFLASGIERFLAKDYVSACSIIYPRIEGLLRKVLSITEPSKKATQKHLAKALIESLPAERRDFSSLLPLKFQAYLEQVYFQDFDVEKAVEISRNSISHGVAAFNDFNLKSASIAFLIIDQLYFYTFSGNLSPTATYTKA